MAAPKGNQYAKGNPNSGRPVKYDEAFAIKEAKAMDEWSKQEDALTMIQFYCDRDYNYKEAKEMAEKYDVFKKAKKRAMARIGSRREMGALRGDFDSAITRKSMGMYCEELQEYEKNMKKEDLNTAVKTLRVITRGAKNSDDADD